MNISTPFTYDPPKRSHVLRRGLSLKLDSLKPGEAIKLTNINARRASVVILNTAKRIGIKVTTRKTVDGGMIAARIA